MNSQLTFPKDIYDNMVQHGSDNLPYESCGLLAGKSNRVCSFWKLENEVRSDKRFFVRKKVVEKTLQQINRVQEQVIAVYHSHPSTAPIPSKYDLFSHVDDEVKMLIVSFKTKDPIVKCYYIKNRNYKECPILIEPTP